LEQGLSVAALSLGVVLLLLGLLGSVKFKDFELGTQSRPIRALVGMLGAAFIMIVFASTGLVRFPASKPPAQSPTAAWAGVWRQAFVGAEGSGFVGRMELRAVDDVTVAGEFESQIDRRRYKGKLAGKITPARRLEGSWSNEYGQRGLFVLDLAADGRSFRGTYAMGEELPSSRPGNVWSGTKAEER
jgi:hypothetical protein